MTQFFDADYLSIIDTAPFGFCLVSGRDYAISYANPAFGPLIGVRTLQTRAPIADCLGPEIEMLLYNQPRSFEQDIMVYVPESKIERQIRVKGEMYNHKGQPHYALWFLDMTPTRVTEEKLRQAIRASEAAAVMKSNLLATMSHEIRTPMQAIFGFLELVSHEKLQPSVHDMIDTARSSASGLLEILDDILDLAKLDADRVELDTFEVPLRMLARGTIEALSVRKIGRSVALMDDISERVPFVVKGDPKRLRQILLNLMGNSIKFTREGSVTLRITTDVKVIRPPENGLALRFEITDTGIGMPPEVCEKLFQPFTQADNSTTRKYGGTGLGLSISKKLVTLMGGQIGVFSEEGKGSTFWFEIPTFEVSTSGSSVNLPSLTGLAILCVEDHPQGQREIVSSLKSMGADVEACATYHEGLELVKRRPFDVAIVDHGLPDGEGLNLMREISELRPSTGLVMYTVHDDARLQHTLRTMGATYLSKPASRLGLGEAIKGASKQHAVQELEGPRRLLIAEDTEIVRTILKRQLKHIGLGDDDVDFVNNGVEAMEALATGRYGILFTDLHMPDMDGYMLVNELRRLEAEDSTRKRLPIIVLTADVQMSQRQYYLKEGFDECLLKPVSLGQLRHLLVRWGLVDQTILDNGLSDKDEGLAGELTQKPAIDLNAMKLQMGDIDRDSVDMVGMFIDMTDGMITKIRGYYEKGDAHSLEEAAHSLKGAARSACCMSLGDIAAQLQEDAKNIAACKELVEKIEAEFMRVRAHYLELSSSMAA